MTMLIQSMLKWLKLGMALRLSSEAIQLLLVPQSRLLSVDLHVLSDFFILGARIRLTLFGTSFVSFSSFIPFNDSVHFISSCLSLSDV